MPKLIRPAFTRALPHAPPTWFDLGFCVSAQGELLCLRASEDVPGYFRERGRLRKMLGSDAAVARKLPPLPRYLRGLLSAFDGEREGEATEFALNPDSPHPAFSRFPNGDWLVSDFDPVRKGNFARVIAPDGAETRRVFLGEGYFHSMQCDLNGCVWVGYDECRSEAIPPGQLAKFDGKSGDLLWTQAGTGFWIGDCWGVNPGADVWVAMHGGGPWPEGGATGAAANYFTQQRIAFRMIVVHADFVGPPAGLAQPDHSTATGWPLLRIGADGEVRHWMTTLRHFQGFAASGDLALVIGAYDMRRAWKSNGYRADKLGLALLRLGDVGADAIAEGRLALGETRDRGALRVFGAGDALHVLTDKTWVRLNVAEVAGALGQL